MSLVSVIIPTCNRLEELRRAIASVLAGSYPEFEILVVNDGSEEQPVQDILESFCDTRIRYLRNQHCKGSSGARNTGLDNALGHYIAYLDDDDEWLPTKLQAQVSRLESLDDSWGGCYCGYLLREGKHWRKVLHLRQGSFLRKFLLIENSIGAPSTLLLRRGAAEKVGHFNEDLARHEDYLYLIRFFREYRLAFVDDILARINGHNIPRSVDAEEAKDKLFQLIRDDLATLDPRDRKRYFALQYRELAMLCAGEHQTARSMAYVRKSLGSALLPPIRYVKMFLAIIDSLLRIHLVDRWEELSTWVKITLLERGQNSHSGLPRA